MASEPELTPEDRALLERLAVRVVELHLTTPAILTLESGRPLSLLAGQTMLFFEPLAQALFGMRDLRRYAALVERREVIEIFTRMIEDRAAAARSAGPGPHAGPRIP